MWNIQVRPGVRGPSPTPAGLTWAGASTPSTLPCTGEANEDYEDYYYDMPAADDPGAHLQPVTPLQLFEGRRSRRRREVPKVAEEQESRVQYTVCIWWVPCVSGGEGWWEETGRGSEVRHSRESIQQACSPCRRNGELGLSGMAIADITLLSGFHALRADLEKVQPLTATSVS